MEPTVSVDVETSSPVDLTTHGAAKYVEHPATKALCLAYHPVGRIDIPGKLWREGDPPPADLCLYVQQGMRFSGWNAMGFDRLVWKQKLVPLGFPEILDDNWDDSMQLAAMANLPRSLEKCAEAVGVQFAHDLKDQARLRRITNQIRTPVIDAEDFEWLCNRCLQDIMMEEENLLRLFSIAPWPTNEPWSYLPAIDRRINDRGILLDIELVEGMARAAKAETHRLNQEIAKITCDAVDAHTKIEPLKRWLVSRGVELPANAPTRGKALEDDIDDDDPDAEEEDTPAQKGSAWRLRKTDIADLLARTDVPEDCRAALAIRAEASKASVRKLNAMMAYATGNGRLYWLLKMGGAQQTMRWSSGGPQLHNLVRDVFANPDEIEEVNKLDKKAPDFKDTRASLQLEALRGAIVAGRQGDAETLRMLYERKVKDAQGRTSLAGVLTWISRMLRRTIAAPEGMTLLNGDFSSAQARITVWLSQQQDMLMAYFNNEDTYKIAAAGIYKIAIEELSKLQRQAGKVSILSGGFGGGPTALLKMAYNYGMLLSLAEATDIITKWREANDNTKQYWYATDDAAANAVMYPGLEFPVPPCGLVSYFMDKSGADCLCCRLPSGRLLRYWAPRLTQETWGDGRPKDRLSLSGLVVKGRGVFRNSLYHTILCLDGLSVIVTCNGLKRLIDVEPQDLLWDGTQWVSHDGVVLKGVKETIRFGGVWMTADHEVMDARGWTRAGDTSFKNASDAFQRHYRIPERTPDGRSISWAGWYEARSMADSMPVWEYQTAIKSKFDSWTDDKLWLSEIAERATQQRNFKARNDKHTTVSHVAEYVRSMSSLFELRLPAVWRERHNSMRSVAQKFRSLLDRHGFFVSKRVVSGTQEQQQRLQQSQLHMGHQDNAKPKQENERFDRYSMGPYYGNGSGQTAWREENNDVLSGKPEMVLREAVWRASNKVPVYDIVNAGPHHRFTIMSSAGEFILVHNCNNQVQGIEADMLAVTLGNLERMKFPVNLHVHDNACAPVPERDAHRLLPYFKEAMLNQPAWTYGLPIGADVEITSRFG